VIPRRARRPDLTYLSGHPFQRLPPDASGGRKLFYLTPVHTCDSPFRSLLREFLDMCHIEEGSA